MLRELNVVEQRYRAVLEVLSGIPVTEVAERYGVARQTVHRWMSRYQTDGISGLAERSHAPKRHPWQIPAQVEAVICDLRRTHRRWGPRRLVFELDRRGYPGLSRSTVYRVLVRHQLIEPVPRRKRREQYRRWERPAPMLLWQMDVTASLFLADGRECKIVTGVDDHSRFCVIATVVLRANARVVCLALVEAMRTYGVPQKILTDNGSVFTGRFMRPARLVRCCLTGSAGRTASPTCSPRWRRRPPRARSSGCTRPCSENCWTCTARSRLLRTPKRRWMPGARTTTPTGRTSRWRWVPGGPVRPGHRRGAGLADPARTGRLTACPGSARSYSGTCANATSRRARHCRAAGWASGGTGPGGPAVAEHVGGWPADLAGPSAGWQDGAAVGWAGTGARADRWVQGQDLALPAGHRRPGPAGRGWCPASRAAPCRPRYR